MGEENSPMLTGMSTRETGSKTRPTATEFIQDSMDPGTRVIGKTICSTAMESKPGTTAQNTMAITKTARNTAKVK
jgi:hypothetical protein